MDYPQLYEVIPWLVVAAVGAFGAFYFYTAFYLKNKPPTQEPVIGNYRVILKGKGREYHGVTTTANHVFSKARILRTLGDEAGAEIIRIIDELHLYAIRSGGDRVLVLSDVDLEGKEFTDSEEGSRYEAGVGWVSYRLVVGYGEEVTRDNAPELYEFFKNDWDAVAFVYPDNIASGEQGFQRSAGVRTYDVTQSFSLLKGAVNAKEQIQARDEVIRVYNDQLNKTLEKLTEQTDRGNLYAEKASLQSPFAPPKEETGDGWGLPFKLTWTRGILILFGGWLGYTQLPSIITIRPEPGAVVGALLFCVLFFIIDEFGLLGGKV
jgi:hypothetical protein